MDVLMRPAIADSKRILARAQAAADNLLPRRYQRGAATGTGTGPGSRATAGQDHDSYRATTPSSGTFSRTGAGAGAGTGFGSSSANRGTGDRGERERDRPRDAAELLSTFITIQGYVPGTTMQGQGGNSASSGPGMRGGKTSSVAGSAGGSQYGGTSYTDEFGNILTSGSNKLIARAVGGSMMVGRFFVMSFIDVVFCS
jgi:hypothetical protein